MKRCSINWVMLNFKYDYEHLKMFLFFLNAFNLFECNTKLCYNKKLAIDLCKGPGIKQGELHNNVTFSFQSWEGECWNPVALKGFQLLAHSKTGCLAIARRTMTSFSTFSKAYDYECDNYWCRDHVDSEHMKAQRARQIMWPKLFWFSVHINPQNMSDIAIYCAQQISSKNQIYDAWVVIPMQ